MGRLGFSLALAFLFAASTSAQQADTPEKRQLDFALGLFQRGEYMDAAREFQVILDHESWKERREVAAFFEGECFRLLDRPDDAAKAYGVLVQGGATGEYAWKGQYRLAKIRLDQSKGSEAAGLLEPLTGRPLPDEFREGVLYSLGAAYSLAGEPRKAADAWAVFRDQFPKSPSARKALVGQAFEEIRLKAWEQAASHLEEWTKDSSAKGDASYATVLAKLAECEEQLGRKGASLKHYVALADIAEASEVRDHALLAAARLAFEEGDWKTFDGLAPRMKKELAAPASQLSGLVMEGNRYYRDKRWKAAAKSFSEALKLVEATPPSADKGESGLPGQIRVRLAWCGLALKDWLMMTQNLEKALEKGGPDEEISFLMGQALAGQEKWQEAADWFARTPDGSSFKPRALAGEADAAYRTDQWERAGKIYDILLRNNPSGAERVAFLVRLGDCKRHLERWIEGADLYSAAAVEAATPEVCEKAIYLEGWCRSRGEDFPGVIKALEGFTAGFPKSSQKPEALYLMGLAYGKTSETNKQVDAFEALAKTAPDSEWNADGLIQLAAVYSSQGNRAGVLSALLRFQKDFPDRKLIREYGLWLADALVQDGSYEKALKTLTPLLSEELADPDKENCLYLKGLCHERTGKWKEALAEYKATLDQFPQGTKVLPGKLGVGRSAQRLGDVAAASKEVVSGLNLLQQSAVSQPLLEAQFYLLEGDLEYQSGRYEEAYRAYARTSILYHHPEYTPRALYMSAVCKEKMADAQAAAVIKEQLAQEYPGFKETDAASYLKGLEIGKR
jgi:outer membrane protein assembly factor BamD (BamD/ComL family)